MDTYVVIWYDMESEKSRDEVEAKDQNDAIAKATKLHNGIKPAELASAYRKDSL